MDVHKIVAELDTEISRLQKIRAALLGVEASATAPKAKRGRPKGSTNVKVAAPTTATKTAPKKKRKLSPEGRKRIVEAMKRRWAKQGKVAKK